MPFQFSKHMLEPDADTVLGFMQDCPDTTDAEDQRQIMISIAISLKRVADLLDAQVAIALNTIPAADASRITDGIEAREEWADEDRTQKENRAAMGDA